MTAEAGEQTIRCRVVYSGRVQGVFFRATSRELARDYAVVGHVRNVPDGTVELEAEGPPAEVEKLLSTVATHFSGYITRAQRTEVPPCGDETRFEIRY